VVRRVHPLEDVDGAVLEAGAVCDTEVEVDGDVGPVDALLCLGRLLAVGGPDPVALVAVYVLVVVFELGIDSHPT